MARQSQSSLACSVAAIALLTATPALAQSGAASGKSNALTNDAPAPAEIVVTGFRAGLQRAQAVKQNDTSVVEALSAEDIGKLPGSSIADSIGRLAGVAGERMAGRVSGISVRGFREDFVGTTLNGRELIGIGDNRGVEYDLYPAEIIDSAVVYKTPNSSLSAMGVGGTVDMRTLRPLSAKRRLTVNGTFEKNGMKSANPDFKDQGYRVALSFSDKFADDTLGIAFTAATTSSPTQDRFFSVWGYDKGAVSSGANAGKYAPSGIDISSRSRVLKRDTLAGVIEYKPSDNFSATFDALYINFSDKGISRGFIEALPIASNGSTVLSSDATTITSARTTGFNSVLRSDPLDKTGKLTTFGGNFKYKASDHVHLTLDVSHAASSKRDTRAESYAGLGRAGLPTQGANNLRTYTYSPNGLTFSNNSQGYSDYAVVRLAGPQSWGGSLAPISALNTAASRAAGVGFAQAQDGFVNTGVFDEKLTSARFEVKVDMPEGPIKDVQLGLRYSDHKKSKVNEGYFLTANTYPLDGAIPDGARRGVADLNWAGLGNVVAYDALGLINSNFYTRWSAAALEPDRMGDTYTIKEKIWQPFAQATFDTKLGGVRTFGNIGLQGVITKQQGSGFNSIIGAALVDIATPITDGANYARVLPSLNANFELGNGHTLRFAAAKVISRARIDYLNPGSSVKFANNVANVTNSNPQLGPWTSRSGNAQLRPYEANQVDLSYEYYFARDGFLSASVFYKDLVNWNVATTTLRDYTQFYIPGYHQAVSSDGLTIYTPATFKGVNTTYTGGLKGKVKGIELQATIPFGRFVKALDGFGVVAGAAFTDGTLNDGTDVPGLSKRVMQGTAFYDKGGFGARVSVNKRSKWVSEDRGGSNTLSPVNRAGQTLVDAQISYDFKQSGLSYLKGLKVSLQGQNLTNQRDTYTDSVSGLTTRNETFGRNFLLNFIYSFY
ncbi:TonB-dependent receptor [Novosphingobium umbonatum]|nr:TonB-dependent receptor [Novosphingobium umbonatum]